MKQCKQCGRMLSVDNFRKYKPRGRGIYNTTQGCHTICKQCESISNRVVTAMNKGDNELLDKLRKHYQDLSNRGLPPVTAAARRLLGIEGSKESKSADIDSLLASVQESAVETHCRLVRARGYASVDEAQVKHRELTEQLQVAGYYEEITELLDDWYFEE